MGGRDQQVAGVTRGDILAASRGIAGHCQLVPVVPLQGQGDVWLMFEFLQKSGSFKYRPMLWWLMRMLEQGIVGPAGIAGATGGNAGAALALAAAELEVPAHIFAPASSPAEKLERIRSYGARLHPVHGDIDAATKAAGAWARENDAPLAHPYDLPEVVAGNGTLARVLEAQVPRLDTVLFANGGGGLGAGLAAWWRGSVKLVAVETEQTPTLYDARAAGERVHVETGGRAASALGVRQIGQLAWDANRFVDEAVVVTEEATKAAEDWLYDSLRIVVEPAAATTVAALQSGAYIRKPGETIALVLCGANVGITRDGFTS